VTWKTWGRKTYDDQGHIFAFAFYIWHTSDETPAMPPISFWMRRRIVEDVGGGADSFSQGSLGKGVDSDSENPVKHLGDLGLRAMKFERFNL
jgi:hypothetical protein